MLTEDSIQTRFCLRDTQSHTPSLHISTSRYIVLDNGLRALLISDFSGTDGRAASEDDEESEEEEEGQEEEEGSAEEGDSGEGTDEESEEGEDEQDSDFEDLDDENEGRKKKASSEKQVSKPKRCSVLAGKS